MFMLSPFAWLKVITLSDLDSIIKNYFRKKKPIQKHFYAFQSLTETSEFFILKMLNWLRLNFDIDFYYESIFFALRKLY